MEKEKNIDELFKGLKMKIIISGRKIDKNIVNLIIGKKQKFDFCSIDHNNKEEFILSSLDKPKWDFYEFKEGFNEAIKDKIYEIIHKNYGDKKKEIESSLIFFSDEDEDDKALLDFFDEKNIYFHPFIIFITNNKKKDKAYYENYIKENELDFDERNIDVIEVEGNYNNIKEKIIKRLWKNCCYYNGIGDNIIIPELELIGAQKELNVKYNNCLNIFITGKPGSGKSRLVNIICNEKKAKERIGGSIFSTNVIKYYIGDSPIALYDTVGFNSRKDIQLTMKKIENKMKQITDDREQIHGIFYVINSNSTRTLDEGEILLIKFILKYEIPIFFLLNYSKYNEVINKKRNNYFESLFEVLENDFPKSNISKFIYLINLKNDYDGNIIFGLDKLFQDLYDFYLPHKINIDELNNNFENDFNNILKAIKHSIFFKSITQLKDALKLCHNKSLNIIKGCCASSFLVGIIPIPLSDAIPISSIELFLFSSILTIYGYKLNKIEMKNAIKSFGFSSISAALGYGVGNTLLLLPGIGTIIGAIIKGSVASLTTLGIGKLCIKYCEDNFEKTNALEFYRNLAFVYNISVEDLKKISIKFSKKVD